MLRQIDGIVLKTRDYGETHKIITILTKQLGKISAIARGANKPKSKLSAVSQVFVQGNFLIYVSKGLSTIQQGQIMASYRSIREDIIKTAYAAYVIELTDKLLDEKQPDPFFYHELSGTLDWIDEHNDYMIPIMMYELKLFAKGGFAPIVDRCVICGRAQLFHSFSIQEGGVLCEQCHHYDNRAVQLHPSLFKLLSIFIHVQLDRVGTISVKKENEQVLRKLFDQYYEAYGGFTLKSKKFLSQIDLLQ